MPSPVLTTFGPSVDAATTLQNAATGTGNGASLTVDPGMQSIAIGVSGGVGTIVLEWSFDGGSTWITAFATTLISGALTASITAAAGIAYYVLAPPPGANRLRARISAFVSGTITVTCTPRRGV